MEQKKQYPKIKPPSKYVGASLDPTVHYKLKVIAAQQTIPLNELARRILTYYANSYMPSNPSPPLPHAVTPATVIDQIPYMEVANNGNRMYG